IDGVVVTFVDISQRRRAEDALRDSEQHLRQQLRLIELSHAPIFIWDFEKGIRQWNRGSEDLYGFTKEEAVGNDKEVLLKTQVPGSSFDALKKELLEKGTWNGELVQTSKAGRPLRVESQVELITVGERRYVLESARDVTQKKAWEAHQKLLLGELTHRVKNILAVVQGMVHQTWRTGSREQFMDRLDGRLAGLSRSHSLLVESDWRGADMRKLVESQLAPYAGDSGRVRMVGEPIALPADIATPFGLVLHELATNAVKYGALSGSRGRIDLNWEVNGNEAPRLRFTWQERDGPRVKEPTANGFGSQLIKKGLAGAKVNYEFPVQGIECTIELPLPG
ncbi:MAG TPA: HWE histidine kinase domain-containing protein, partial [Rhizomicrobium sp.]|nr:HWE histidine kinase domain-containing protein [Rhizomicrobium sp.]